MSILLDTGTGARGCSPDLLACVAVNDPFVLAAWGKDRGVGDAIVLLADGSGDFTRAMGLELDASAFGMGRRSSSVRRSSR
jgi:glutaredoxin/glutathione-dependent peroxiredoxin